MLRFRDDLGCQSLIYARICHGPEDFDGLTRLFGCSPSLAESTSLHINCGIWAIAQAKIVTEQELKRALSILRDCRHADRDRLALLVTDWKPIEFATS